MTMLRYVFVVAKRIFNEYLGFSDTKIFKREFSLTHLDANRN